MRTDTFEQVKPAVSKIQGRLGKIDRLRLSAASQRDIASILVRQVSKEIDRALPWQTGHSTRTAAIAGLMGQSLELSDTELHDLTLGVGAARLPV